MLHQRLITAVILLAILLAALFAPVAWPMVLILTIVAGIVVWEWLRLVIPPTANPHLAAYISSVFFVVALATGSQALVVQPDLWALGLRYFTLYGLSYVVAAVWVVFATGVVLIARTEAPRASVFHGTFAVLAVWCAWLSLVQLYLSYGPWFLLSFLAFIWVADSAAYFVGRRFGRMRLAPNVSPGKTVEGAAAGVLAAIIWVLITAFTPNGFGAVLVLTWSWTGAILLAFGLACLSIIGDLYESLLKRRANQKDSSHLLPGHGGLYDRVDALLPVATLAFLLLGANSL